MALSRTREDGSVALTEVEAMQYVWDIVGDWNKLSESWGLKYGSTILGVTSAFTGVYINNFYRNKLKLGQFGLLSSILPITALPGMCSAFFHRHLISTNILLDKEDCFVCTELRSAAFQALFGLFYPFALGPACGFLLANRYATYRLPSLRYKPKEVYETIVKISRPLKGPVLFISVFQMAASSLITYTELQNHIAIQNSLRRVEQKLERNKR